MAVIMMIVVEMVVMMTMVLAAPSLVRLTTLNRCCLLRSTRLHLVPIASPVSALSPDDDDDDNDDDVGGI